MNTITINSLQFSGSHGVEAEEREKPQPFSVDISAEYNFSRSIQTDDIADTIDYRTIEAIVRNTIEGPPRKLVERLAGEIAQAVLDQTPAESVDIRIAKLQAPSHGIPSVTLQQKKVIYTTEQVNSISDVLGIDAAAVQALYDPQTDGILHLKGVLYKILNEEKVKEWYAKKWPNFEKKEEKYIQNNQEVAVVYKGTYTEQDGLTDSQEIALHNLYHRVRKELAKYSDIPFRQGDELETKLIKYPISTLGVGAHRDQSANINAIILFNLYGTTTFYTSSDKQRLNEKGYLVGPGDIVIMRGPRTKAENDLRPIHYVLDIQEGRLVFVCREIDSQIEAVINKNNWMGF